MPEVRHDDIQIPLSECWTTVAGGEDYDEEDELVSLGVMSTTECMATLECDVCVDAGYLPIIRPVPADLGDSNKIAGAIVA